MTIIVNPFAHDCRHLLSKYTISTLQSIDIVDNQKDYGCILKCTRFSLKQDAVLCYGYRDILLALQSLFYAILRCKGTHFSEVFKS